MSSRLTKNLLPQTTDCNDPWGIGFYVKIRRSGHLKAAANSSQTVKDRIALATAYSEARTCLEAAGREVPNDLGRMALADPGFAAALGSIMTSSKEFQTASYVAGWGNTEGAEEPFFSKAQLPKGGAFSHQDVVDKFFATFGNEDDEEVFEIPPFMLADKSDFVYDLEKMEAASKVVVGYLDSIASLSTKPKKPANEESSESADHGDGESADHGDSDANDSLKTRLEELADERDRALLDLGVMRSPFAGQPLRSAVVSWIDEEAAKLQSAYEAKKLFLPRTSK